MNIRFKAVSSVKVYFTFEKIDPSIYLALKSIVLEQLDLSSALQLWKLTLLSSLFAHVDFVLGFVPCWLILDEVWITTLVCK